MTNLPPSNTHPPVKSIVIHPMKLQVQSIPALAEVGGATGAAMVDSGLILYDPAQSLDSLKETLTHESLHGIWAQTWMKYKYPDGNSDSTGEKVIGTLSPRLVAWMKDNKRLVRWIIGDVP